jgi:hypothetical protein
VRRADYSRTKYNVLKKNVIFANVDQEDNKEKVALLQQKEKIIYYK